MHTIIIGGGAAGMAAAIAAAEAGSRVTVLERNRRPLKKLGVTGNGRGNLLNAGPLAYPGGADFAAQTLRAMPYERLAAFLTETGIPLRVEEEGRVYPASLLASTAVDALLLRARRLRVEVVTGARAASLKRLAAGGFEVGGSVAAYLPDAVKKSGKIKPGTLAQETPAHWRGDRVIVAAGGAAAPAHGTDGAAYGLLTAFGHELTAPRPALCALVTDPLPIRELTGQRVRAALTLLDASGTLAAQSRGEALFAQDGVSGIAAMQLARSAAPGCVLCMDLREGVLGPEAAQAPVEEIARLLDARMRDRRELPLRELLTGAAPACLTAALLRAAGLSALADRPMEAVRADRVDAPDALAGAICRFCVEVRGTRGFEAAQVTAGGVCTADFDPATMESRLCPGLFAAGEILDVDGGCGGYNLMFAFAGGLLAGRNAARTA